LPWYSEIAQAVAHGLAAELPRPTQPSQQASELLVSPRESPSIDPAALAGLEEAIARFHDLQAVAGSTRALARTAMQPVSPCLGDAEELRTSRYTEDDDEDDDEDSPANVGRVVTEQTSVPDPVALAQLEVATAHFHEAADQPLVPVNIDWSPQDWSGPETTRAVQTVPSVTPPSIV